MNEHEKVEQAELDRYGIQRVPADVFCAGRLLLFECPRCAGRRKEELEVTSGKRRLEDTAEGCRSLAKSDRARATETMNPHMRVTLERSADAWIATAKLLDRLETSFNERAAANCRPDCAAPMNIAGSIDSNLRAALQCARRLKDGPVHPDTVDHWARAISSAK